MKHDIHQLFAGLRQALANKNEAEIANAYHQFVEYEDEMLNVAISNSKSAEREEKLKSELKKAESQLADLISKFHKMESLDVSLESLQKAEESYKKSIDEKIAEEKSLNSQIGVLKENFNEQKHNFEKVNSDLKIVQKLNHDVFVANQDLEVIKERLSNEIVEIKKVDLITIAQRLEWLERAMKGSFDAETRAIEHLDSTVWNLTCAAWVLVVITIISLLAGWAATINA